MQRGSASPRNMSSTEQLQKLQFDGSPRNNLYQEIKSENENLATGQINSGVAQNVAGRADIMNFDSGNNLIQ